MNTTSTDAARLIAAHWDAGTKLASLPEACRPDSLAQGYRVQTELARVRDSPVVGWKIAATAQKGRQHIGVDGPIAGRVFADRRVLPGQICPMHGNRMRVAECEFVFVLGTDLPARDTPYNRDEVLAAVAELRPGLELPDSRFQDFASVGAAALVADDACAHYLVIGEATTAHWRDRDLAAHATCLRVNGKVVTHGTGADVLGHPLDALTFIANNHGLQGSSLAAGQFITTGVTGTPWPIVEGDTIVADLGDLGQVHTVMGR